MKKTKIWGDVIIIIIKVFCGLILTITLVSIFILVMLYLSTKDSKLTETFKTLYQDEFTITCETPSVSTKTFFEIVDNSTGNTQKFFERGSLLEINFAPVMQYENLNFYTINGCLLIKDTLNDNLYCVSINESFGEQNKAFFNRYSSLIKSFILHGSVDWVIIYTEYFLNQNDKEVLAVVHEISKLDLNDQSEYYNIFSEILFPKCLSSEERVIEYCQQIYKSHILNIGGKVNDTSN